MAPTSTEHQFQKLKLDTAAPHKPVTSSFASISREDVHRPTSLNGAHHRPDLAEAQFYLDDTPPRHTEDRRSYDVDSAIGDELGQDVQGRCRERRTSISFNDTVTLDNGDRLSLEEPLPKSTTATSFGSEDSEWDESSDRGYVGIPLHRNTRRRLAAQAACAPLQTRDDAGAQDQDQVASLTSGETASPVDEVRTPPETPSLFGRSPAGVTSPVDFFPRRTAPRRTMSSRSVISPEESNGTPRHSRRSSTRSGRSLSSMSPAASFLSLWKTAERPLKPPEPDDEGQGIGYDGEYIIGRKIGSGGFSVVKEVTTIENGERVVHAVKIVRKQLPEKSELENDQIQSQFDHELEIWRYLRHPYILPLLRVYNSDFATFCITRLNKGGTLFDLVRDAHRKKKKGLDGHLAKRYAYQLASAIRYLHNDVMVVHRDIKLENCLLDMTKPRAEQDGGDVLLCDFGMADFIVSDHRDGQPEPHLSGENPNIGPADTSTSVQGSLQYAAPELFNAPTPVFSPAADIWAFGVVVYTLLTANLPFKGPLDPITCLNIQKGEWDAEAVRNSDAVRDGGAEEALELLRGCLHMDPEKRWTINDVLSCAWLNGCAERYEDVNCPWMCIS
ncbi:kinase-like protein [Westerdykella ornata]|uniref:Kinase-like protein n=1 Tax=Westerdykella ornata TaxID=318751 RepID=A0A6A6K161_WESOR|nr:kinase-like protein [Westerdykella ornata]KAF2281089.1 kinase-like protein [Westerdykella ornata]